MEPARMPDCCSRARTLGTSARPSGRSHSTCRARVGQAPVSAFTLAGVGELFFEAGGGGGLEKLAEARAGVGESPGGDFDAKVVQRLS